MGQFWEIWGLVMTWIQLALEDIGQFYDAVRNEVGSSRDAGVSTVRIQELSPQRL